MERISAIVAPLCTWYRHHARALPWRENPTPYHIWLSEVMLQQTRIEAVKPYYARFLTEAPTVSALAALSDERLMKLWEGLGYYSRARNLKRAAQVICEKHGGALPADYDELLALPGIGEYTAGAIASIAFGLPRPAVDGNVLRVMTRLLGDESDILLPQTKKGMTHMLAEAYRAAEDPASLTQGLMELGEVVCMPNRAPLCEACPLSAFCRARADGSWDHIPYRAPKKARRIVHKLVLILHDGQGRYAIRRRPEEGLLSGLWELPQMDLLPEIAEGEDGALDELVYAFCREHGLIPEESASAPDAKHIFTHLEWHMRGRYVNVRREQEASGDLVFVTAGELRSIYALPTAFHAYARLLYHE
ncbi:MAG: A/G-specific adenine glycosylase [Clostridia bacterium]|nr:A/G-specific adenine glycosylase [Clostridia bacterium]